MTLEQASAGKPAGTKKARKPSSPKQTPEQRAAATAAKAEKKRLADEKKARAAAEKAENKLKADAEKKRLADEKKARAAAEKAENKLKADAEKKRLADEKKARAAAEKAEKAENKRKADAEEKRLADEKKARAAAEKAENKRKADIEKKARAEAEKQRLVAERSARARKPELFMSAIRSAVSGSNQVVGLAQVAKKVSAADRTAFSDHWKNAIASGALPPGVSSLLVGTKRSSARKLFLVSHAVPALTEPSREAPSPISPDVPAATPSVSSSTPLKERLIAEFDRLHERGGGRFYVPLFDLRQALPGVSRSDFDAALNELRKDWVLTLNAAEGRHENIPANVRDAGIMEQSKLLVYVARRGT